MVRPHPGQAVTCGVKLRMPSDCRICCATRTSSVRSPPGAGVSETRIVSPIPSCSRHGHGCAGGHDAFGSHAGFGQSEMQRVFAARSQDAIDVDQILDPADFCAEDDLVGAQSVTARPASPNVSALTTIASMVTSRASFGSGRSEFSSIMRVRSA